MPGTPGKAIAGHDWVYRDVATLAGATRWLLYAQVVFSALWVYFAFRDEGIGTLEAFIQLISILLWIANIVTVLWWTYMANANARALGADDLMATPAMSAAWYFIPLAQLFMPFQAMREIWKGSARPKDWESASTPAILILWWLFWLTGCFAGSWAMVETIEASSWSPYDAGKAASHLRAAELLDAASGLFMLPAAMLLAAIVARIQAMQTAHRVAAP